jgi:hypothetical protein
MPKSRFGSRVLKVANEGIFYLQSPLAEVREILR